MKRLKDETPNSNLNPDLAFLVSLTEDQLYQECVRRLETSFEVKAEPFRDEHEAVDRVRLECQRRGKDEIFNQAFYDF